MTSTSVHDVLDAINEARGALEREPQLRQQCTDLQYQLDDACKHTQGLEIAIRGYKDQIDQLQSRVRSLEVERDDASFRLLETEDTLNSYRVKIEAFNESIAHLMPVVPTPEPVASLDEMKEAVQGTNTDPFVGQGGGMSEPFTVPSPTATQVPISEGQSASSPTLNQDAPSGLQTNALSAPSLGAESTTAAPSSPFVDKPYEGKRWSEIWPRVQSLDAWKAGGGDYSGWCN